MFGVLETCDGFLNAVLIAFALRRTEACTSCLFHIFCTESMIGVMFRLLNISVRDATARRDTDPAYCVWAVLMSSRFSKNDDTK